MEPETTEILLLESNPANLELMRTVLSENGFSVTAIDTPERIGHALQNTPHYRAALLDSSGFGPTFWDACKDLHHSGIPFVVVVPQPADSNRRPGLEHGAHAVLSKPLTRRQLVMALRALTEA